MKKFVLLHLLVIFSTEHIVYTLGFYLMQKKMWSISYERNRMCFEGLSWYFELLGTIFVNSLVNFLRRLLWNKHIFGLPLLLCANCLLSRSVNWSFLLICGVDEFVIGRILFRLGTYEDLGGFQNERCLFSMFHSEFRSLLLMLWICSEEGKSICKMALLMYHLRTLWQSFWMNLEPSCPRLWQ